MRWAMTRVLPEPAPARISSGPSLELTASRCCGLSWERKSKTYPLRLKNCTARSCFSAAARVENVPRFLRLPVFGSFLREYRRYSPDFNFLIIFDGFLFGGINLQLTSNT